MSELPSVLKLWGQLEPGHPTQEEASASYAEVTALLAEGATALEATIALLAGASLELARECISKRPDVPARALGLARLKVKDAELKQAEIERVAALRAAKPPAREQVIKQFYVCDMCGKRKSVTKFTARHGICNSCVR